MAIEQVADTPVLRGRRTTLRPLEVEDFSAWREVRRRNAELRNRWEPRRTFGQPDPGEDRRAFAMRCAARRRERQLGTGWGFGVFLDEHGSESFIGEMNLSNVVRGAFRSATVGYWVDQDRAGNEYIPESLVVACRFAFEEIDLHRLQVSIVPRNTRSRRVVEKLGLRCEGQAERYLEINGVWEDHLQFAITAEEWCERRADLCETWLEARSS